MASPENNPRPSPVMELIGADIAALPDRERVCVAGVDWRLQADEFWVVGGLNWSGKTDWLATVGGLQLPAAGRQRIFDCEIERMDNDQLLACRLRIGFVFEGGGRLFGDFTVAENITLPVCYHRNCTPEEAFARVEPLLARTDLRSLANLRVGQLSRGQRMRTALARALALNPEVLLVDNPIAHLDPRHARWCVDFLGDLRRERGLAVVVTSEDFRPWLEPATHFSLLSGGRWRTFASRDELLASTDPMVREMVTDEVVARK